jgi:adenosine deaminase
VLAAGAKVELHCHADNLLDPAMLARLLAAGHDYPLAPDDLARVTPIRSLDEWLGPYCELVEPCLEPWTRMLPMIEAHVEALVAQKVVYTELMVARLLRPLDVPLAVAEEALLDRYRAVRAAVDRAAAGRIQVELLAAIGRGPRARSERQSERILLLARAGLIRGVAIAGVEEGAWTIASIADLVASWRDAGLGIEIHAGELAGPASVWDALEHGRPDRIGHGVRAFEDERLVDALGERGVHLEFCPTSNLLLGCVPRLADHPIVRARDLGLSYSVNTDDPGPFGCSMTSELALLERELGFDERDFARIREHAWAARFGRD